MKTSRLKNVIIAILALVNAFLLVLLVSRRAQERAARDRAETQLIRLYAASGVELPAALIPSGDARLSSVDPTRSLSAESAFAEALLGPCMPEDVGGGIFRYVGESGQCLLRSSGTIEAEPNRAVDDPEAYCEELFASCGYAALSSDVGADGSGTIVAVRMLPNGMVFNAELELVFSEGLLRSVTGSFVPPVEPGERGEGIDGVTALTRFLDYSNGSGEVCTAVTDVRGGYLLQSTASASQRLIPAWSVATDVNRFYVNMLTGEVSRES